MAGRGGRLSVVESAWRIMEADCLWWNQHGGSWRQIVCDGISMAGRGDRLVGLVVRRPPPERKVPGSNPACAGIFSGSSHTSDLKIGYPARRLAL